MALKELPFNEQYDENCSNCGGDMYGWEWDEDMLEFTNNCSDCGTEYILRPTQATLEMIATATDDDE